MTSNNSSTNMNPKRGSFLFNNVRSYWWLALICTVIYGFAGPVYTLLKIDSITQPSRSNYLSASTEESLLEEYLRQMAGWFSSEGFIFLYISAIVLASIIGCVMFFYLQNKRQTNFYHSQPISRTRLFLSQYVTGLLINVIPLLIMTVVSLLITSAYNMGAALDFTGILLHIAYMLLLLFASYSIAIFAGQLTGTMLTHVVFNTVLHFCVPIVAALANFLCELFLATYSGNSNLVTSSLNFSPFCAAIKYLDGIPFPSTNVMTVTPMAGSMVAVLLILGVAAGMLAWVLYQKRPSETTGKALIYPVTEPLLKTYLMFVVSIATGLVFVNVGSKIFFYFAVIVFAIMTHMTCEVIFQRDFKAMGKRMPQCLVILVLIFAVISVFRFDLTGYDDYLPKPEQVKEVSFIVTETDAMRQYDNYRGFGGNTNKFFCDDEAVKQSIYDMLQPIIEEEQYRSSSFEYIEHDTWWGDSSPIEVEYILKNGKTVSRYYRDVSLDMIKEPYRDLYNQLAYRECLYRGILQVQPKDIRSMDVEKATVLLNIEGALVEKSAIENATKLLEAYQQDLLDRQFNMLEKMYMDKISLEQRATYNGRHYTRIMELPVYADDKRTIALLRELNLFTGDRGVSRNFEQALIFRCDAKERKELQKFVNDIVETAKKNRQLDNSLNSDDYIKLFAGKAELTGQINGNEAVDIFIQESKLLQDAGSFTKYDETHFAFLRYDDPDRAEWSFQLFYADTVPEQYQ